MPMNALHCISDLFQRSIISPPLVIELLMEVVLCHHSPPPHAVLNL